MPTPNPQLERLGGNLPAVVQSIKAHRPEDYRALLGAVKQVMPTLENLDVMTTHQKTLALFFREAGFSTPWRAEEVSDGTIRAVALLAALFDPALDVVVIEEPENSLHPWAIRQFVDACRVAMESKQIILTTHSPILINHLTPTEVWVVQRPGAETRIDALTALDPEAEEGWQHGHYGLAEYLDSGAVPASVPAPWP